MVFCQSLRPVRADADLVQISRCWGVADVCLVLPVTHPHLARFFGVWVWLRPPDNYMLPPGERRFGAAERPTLPCALLRVFSCYLETASPEAVRKTWGRPPTTAGSPLHSAASE